MSKFGSFWNRATLLAVILAALTGTLHGNAALGQTNREELEREKLAEESTRRSAEAELSKIDVELRKLRNTTRTNQTRLSAALLELRRAEEQVKLQQSRVSLAKREVNRLSGEITVTAETIKTGQKRLATRAQDLMKSSRLAGLELLLKSEDAAELELHERFLSIEATADVDMIQRTVEAKNVLEEKKSDKEIVLAELVQRERELASARNQVIVKRNELQRLQKELAQTTADKEEAKRKTQAMLREIKNRIAGLSRKMKEIQGRFAAPTVFHAPADGDIIVPPVSIPGVYISQTHGSVVKSMAEGEVVSIQNMHGLGQTIIVGHGGNLTSVYANLSSVSVNAGQKLRRGQEIGRSGTSPYGDATYFAVYLSGVAQNPRNYL